ncbi:MAG: glutathione S-transferase [Magnetovibrio sp.]|nr:glutathione S-transferase [Magnetovibrio sp.]|tara:strand:+ start:418 stop:1047 length:630 start_codon:yes stop_codon:yes gene_type:complete
MKLYDYHRAPNPRRVRIFLAEKGIEIEKAEIDLGSKQQMETNYKTINSRMSVPMLELDDGNIITESIAICRYFEETQPDPTLFGNNPLDKATVEMWHRRVELEGLMPISDAVRNSVEFFAGRAMAGPIDFVQIPALAERANIRMAFFYNMLNERLNESAYIAGSNFSIADITALVAIDFARIIKQRIGENQTALQCWYDKVSMRPSAVA